jgi:protein-disulfide isomerase
VRVGPTLDKIMADYPKDVRVVFKMHPLPMHQHSMEAAEAAMAANAQGKFAAMHGKLLENSTALSRDKFLALAAELGLDVKKFTNDIDTHAHKASIDAAADEAMKVGASGTPASFVNGRFLSGAQPYEAFKKLIDEELAKAPK